MCIALFITVCCFRNETIGYLVENGKEEECKKALKQIYMGETDAETQERYDELAKNSGTDKKEEEAKEGGEYEAPTYEGGEEADAEAEANKDKAEAEADEKKAEGEAGAEEKEAEAALADGKAALDAAKNWREKLPAFLQSKPGEVSAFDALTKADHRSGTWFCFALGLFNVMTGTTLMLVYVDRIFAQVDDKHQLYKLTNKQIGSGLTTALVFGAASSIKVLAVVSRRGVFIGGHLLIGACMALVGYSVHLNNGVFAFGFLCASQFLLQIISAPLFMYQSEVLVNSALGMSTALRSFIFMGLKHLVTNLIESKTPIYQFSLGDIFLTFGAFQLLSALLIYIFMMETKGVKDKKNICNPVKQAAIKVAKLEAKEAKKKVVITGVWEETTYKRPESKITNLIEEFVKKSFEKFNLNVETDCMSKYNTQRLLIELMHENYEFDAWDHYKFENTFNLFEEDELTETLYDNKNEGLDKSEFTKLVKRLAKL